MVSGRGVPAAESNIIGETPVAPKLDPAPNRENVAIGYNFRLPRGCAAMEAERINQIAGSLADLKARTDELRRYL